MQDEIEKMRNGQLADFDKPELQESLRHAKILLSKMRTMSIYDAAYRPLLEELIPGIPASSVVMPPFHCDHGHGIKLGERVFVNAGCTFLDGAYIRIGNYTLVGPNVQIYTPHHPIDYIGRRENKEYSFPVTIGEDCWIGGNVTICPGVTIGHRCIVAAGSVVIHDVPDGCMVAGNPAQIKKRLEK